MSIISYIKEVSFETKKIKWPTKKQVIGYTVVVTTLSFLLAIYLGALDAFFARLLSIIL